MSECVPERGLRGYHGAGVHVLKRRNEDVAQADDVFVSQVLQKFQFAISPLGKNRGAEGLHNFLNSNRLCGQLIPRGAIKIGEPYQYEVQFKRGKA
jgi:hypothetical protein